MSVAGPVCLAEPAALPCVLPGPQAVTASGTIGQYYGTHLLLSAATQHTPGCYITSVLCNILEVIYISVI